MLSPKRTKFRKAHKGEFMVMQKEALRLILVLLGKLAHLE